MARFCLNCGEEVQENTKFCASCGHATDPSAPAEIMQNAPEQQPQYAPQQQPPVFQAPPIVNEGQPPPSADGTPFVREGGLQPQQYAPQQYPPQPTPPIYQTPAQPVYQPYVPQQQYTQPQKYAPQQYAPQQYAPQQPQFPQQPYAPPPPSIPNSEFRLPNLQYPPPPQIPNSESRTPNSKKKPFIFAGAGVIVVALVVAGIFTNGFGLFGKKADDGDNNSVKTSSDGSDKTRASSSDSNGSTANTSDSGTVSIYAPDGASDVELIMYAYIENVVSIFDLGNEYAELGLDIAAGLPYGTAAASVCAMRYAVDNLLELQGEAPAQDGRYQDWDEISALGRASPYPYLFEGFVLNATDGIDAAKPCYEKACLNPAISEDDTYLIYILSLDVGQLQTLRTALTDVEDMIFDAFEPISSEIPRSEYNYDPGYLWEQGQNELEQPEPDAAAALNYYRAALALEPFDGDGYAALVALYLELESSESAIYWLNEGLFIDPDNGALNTLLEAMNEVLG